jgi:hypothetical protein
LWTGSEHHEAAPYKYICPTLARAFGGQDTLKWAQGADNQTHFHQEQLAIIAGMTRLQQVDHILN